jgi:hypothetical protein
MTKKSAARLERDQFKENFKNNTCWDDINNISNECRAWFSSVAEVSKQLLNKDLIPFYSDYKSVQINMSTFTTDLNRVTQEFLDIQALHRGKSGSASDPDELMSSFPIYEKYTNWLEHIHGVVMPIFNYLVEELGIASSALIERAKKEQLTPEQDPNVITDVIVK